MSFDFGLRFTGVAVGQTITKSANGVTTLDCKDGRPDWHQVRKLIDEHKPTTLIVGLPLNMDGTESEMTGHARQFAQQLASKTGLPVELQDERLTSHAADEQLQIARQQGRAKTDHELAACLILEQYLQLLD